MSGKHSIGIIQGRLTPSGGKLQCFPYGKWREEFFVAADVGFDSIELIVERQVDAPNPIWEPEGVQGLIEVSKASGVKAVSVCDDRIMDASLLTSDGPEAEARFAGTVKLIHQMGKIGATRLILPFLEQASLKDDRDGFFSVRGHLEKLVPIAEDNGVMLLLEDDMPVPMLKELVSTTDGKVGVCFDTGNRACFGFDPSEILELGPLIGHVHVKDKEPGGKNVMLGKGKVDFRSVFSNLKKLGYGGPLILETSRGDEETQAGRENLAFVQGLLRGQG